MNRRSFIAGVLAALAAPAILVPKARDHARWRVRRHKGLYIAEFKYVCLTPPREEKEFEFIFFKRDGVIESPVPAIPELSPETMNFYAGRPYPFRGSTGSWTFKEWHGPPSEVLATL